MGKKNEIKNEIEKKPAVVDGGAKAAVDGGVKVAADGGGKKQVEPTTVVLKLDLHCEGCAKKVRRSISQLEGVEKVKADCKAKKLIVTGNVDPTRLLKGVETKIKKKVELLSPPPKLDGGAAAAGGDKKADEKPKTEEIKAGGDDKKPKEADGDDKKPKEAVVNTVVMKTKLHCDGCATKIKRIIFKNFEGIESVTTDLQKDLIIVTGTMEVEKLVTNLREKLKRVVDVIPPPKKDTAAATEKGKKADNEEKKEKDTIDGGEGGGEGKKEKGKEAKVEVNKMEHHNNNNSQTHYAMAMSSHMPMSSHMMYNQSYGAHDDGMMMHPQYPNAGYMAPYGHGAAAPPLPPPTYLIPESDNMFSDENPNGCSIM